MLDYNTNFDFVMRRQTIYTHCAMCFSLADSECNTQIFRVVVLVTLKFLHVLAAEKFYEVRLGAEYFGGVSPCSIVLWGVVVDLWHSFVYTVHLIS